MEYWSIRKTGVASKKGVVVSQHAIASKVGASVLAKGGNAIDAAIATGFALGCVEPWMSGIGGCGFMVTRSADTGKAHAIEFGVKAPFGLNVKDYPLSPGFDSDLFSWPGVIDNRNVSGPFSVAIPSYVAGVSLALDRFGTWSWKNVLSPSIDLASKGMSVDWYSSLKILSAASDISKFECSRSIYLPNGHGPIGSWSGEPPKIYLQNLDNTLRILADEGSVSFYTGCLAKKIVDDCKGQGIIISLDDLESYKPIVSEIEGMPFRDSLVYAPEGLCGGPSLIRAMEMLQESKNSQLNGEHFLNMANCLETAYEERLMEMGDSPDGKAPACTTHINVVDSKGNTASLTQTLLSVFGSKVVLPKTGILMNNGIMWFDPEAGKRNSIGPGRKPLSNMCPTIITDSSDSVIAIGASGGRRIISSIFQVISFLIDFGMTPQEALDQPRIDISGSKKILLDDKLGKEIKEKISDSYEFVESAYNGVYPSLFGCPSIAAFNMSDRLSRGYAFMNSPLSAAIAGDFDDELTNEIK